MSIVQVTQAPRGGAVTSTLYLTNWYLDGVLPTDNTIVVSFQSSQGVLCSTTAPATAATPCPSGLTGKACAKVTCNGPPPATASNEFIIAFINLCPSTSLKCASNFATAFSPVVSLIPPALVVTAPKTTAEPGKGTDAPATTAAPPVVVDVPGQPPVEPVDPNAGNANKSQSGGSGSGNGGSVGGVGAGLGGTSPTSPSSSSSSNSSNQPGISPNGNVPAIPGSQGPLSGSLGGNNVTGSSSSNSAALIGGGLVAIVAVFCAVAFLVQSRRRRQRRASSGDRDIDLTPDLPFGKPVNSLEDGDSIPPPPETPLPRLPTNASLYASAKAYDSSVAPAAFRSLDRVYPGPVGAAQWSESPASSSGSSNGTKSSNSYVSFEAVHRGEPTPVSGLAAVTVNSDKSAPVSMNAASAITQETPAAVVVHPGYYDEDGNYHYFTTQQMLQLQEQIELQEKQRSQL